MINGNTAFSPQAIEVIKRVQLLREFTKKTGYTTNKEQADELLTLDGPELLSVVEHLKFGGFGGAR